MAELHLVRPMAHVLIRCVTTCVLYAVSCSTAALAEPSVTDRERQLVGTSLANDFDFSQSLKVRRADHTFIEYRFQVIDDSKPGVALTLHGTWALKGRQYCETVTEVSYPAWKTLVGRAQCYDVVTLTPDLLQYFSRDSAPIRERRISDSNARRFMHNLFSFVSDDVRNKYGFERH